MTHGIGAKIVQSIHKDLMLLNLETNQILENYVMNVKVKIVTITVRDNIR